MVRRSCSVSGGTKRVLFMSYELLKSGDSITGDRYRLQLIRLSRALREKRLEYEQRHNKVILLHDNARLHVAKVVNKYLKRSNGMFYRTRYVLWTLLLLISGCSEGCSKFTSFAEIENWIASKDESFFRDRIRKLLERWEKVIGSDGQYFNWFVHSFCFKINAFLNIKKRTELICTPNKYFENSELFRCTLHELQYLKTEGIIVIIL